MDSRCSPYPRISRLLAWAALTPVFLHAQMGAGWTEYKPVRKIHLDDASGLRTFNWSPAQTVGCADYAYDEATGIETFRLLQTCTNRSEIRLQNDYTSGKRQFEGEVRVSGPTDDESIAQVFGGSAGGATTQMIRAFSSDGGCLRKFPGEVMLIKNIYSAWVKVNVIHDVGADRVSTYINGALAATGGGEGPSSWYHKYGCYGTLRTGTAKVEWRKVKHFQGGDSAPVLPSPVRSRTSGASLAIFDLAGARLGRIDLDDPARLREWERWGRSRGVVARVLAR